MGALFEMYPGLDSSTSTMKTSLPYGKLLTVDNQKLTVTTNIFRNQSECPMFDHSIALPHLTPFQNRIRPNDGNDQEELQNEIRMQRHALLAVKKAYV